MKFLLDTNIIIWFMEGSSLLNKDYKQIIISEQNEIFISMASLWEISIKFALGKLKISDSLENFFYDIINEYEFIRLPITEEHLLKQSKLPFHHKDPFDRLIIAQSLVENIEIIYTDKAFNLYKL